MHKPSGCNKAFKLQATVRHEHKQLEVVALERLQLQLEERLLRDKLDTLCGGPGHANTRLLRDTMPLIAVEYGY